MLCNLYLYILHSIVYCTVDTFVIFALTAFAHLTNLPVHSLNAKWWKKTKAPNYLRYTSIVEKNKETKIQFVLHVEFYAYYPKPNKGDLIFNNTFLSFKNRPAMRYEVLIDVIWLYQSHQSTLFLSNYLNICIGAYFAIHINYIPLNMTLFEGTAICCGLLKL